MSRRLDPRALAKVREVSAELGRFREGGPGGLELTAAALPSLLEAELGCGYTLRACDDGHWQIDALHGVGFDRARFQEGMNGALRRDGPLYDPRRPQASQRNRALTTAKLLSLGIDINRLFEEHLPDMRLHHKDELRAVVCDGDRYLGLVVACRPEPFEERECDVLQALVPAIASRLALEAKLGLARVASAALPVVLDAIPGEAYLVRCAPGTPHVAEANALGRSELERDRAGVLSALRDSLDARRGAPFSVARIDAPGVPAHALCTRARRAPAGDQRVRLAVATREWNLTRRQVDVLALLARGLANKAIAFELGCAEGTVELHVSALFAKSGTGSRAELAARYWCLELRG